MTTEKQEFPARFIDLKKQLVAADDPEVRGRLTTAWADLLAALACATNEFAVHGSDYIPQVEFADIDKLSKEEIAKIKTRGCVVVRNVVDDDEALGWKQAIKDYVAANPSIPGFPEGDKQFFHMYWSKSQVRARAHPNVLATQVWLNSLYNYEPAHQQDGVDLGTPLVYADRLRIRHPGPVKWFSHVPHIDGGSIERWEDPGFRTVYADILRGSWKEHDAYDFNARIGVNSNIYGRPSQSSVFRTFQGWLSMSDTGPNEGTLQVFPDVILSSAYLILRPFFRPTKHLVSGDHLDPQNWELDTSTADFPGIFKDDEFFSGPFISEESHPHLKVSETMVSIPHVKPGDMVFWHCDLIHAVETDHRGSRDSSVMYIPAVPVTPQNVDYIKRQKEHFLRGAPPPDFSQNQGEIGFKDLASDGDIDHPLARTAMGLPLYASA